MKKISLRLMFPSEYQTWKGMKERVNNPNSKTYYRYGGRGVLICPRWIESFNNFISDMREKPSPKHQLDRIDNNGNYTWINCRWVTPQQNGCNSSVSKRWFIFGDEYESLNVAESKTGITKGKIKYMCDGATVDGVYYPPKGGCYSESLYAN